MKPSQNTIIHVLLGLIVLAAIGLFYALLVPQGHFSLSPVMWGVFAPMALALALAAFLPSLLRRRRGLPPPPPMARADLGIYIVITLVGCALAVIGVISGMWWIMTLGIMFAPLYLSFHRKSAP